MLLGSIRSRLLVLVLATVVPFMALVGAGLWSQWREDRAAAVERALNEARLLAAQLDDHDPVRARHLRDRDRFDKGEFGKDPLSPKRRGSFE